MEFGQLKLMAGNSNPALAASIAKYLKLKMVDSVVSKFSDSEVRVEINESMRGSDVFVIQSTCHPCNDNLMELLIIMDALKRASAARITAVIPYYGYARQDRKAHAREPISAKLVADLIATAGADRALTLDLHSAQIQGFFNIPVDNLLAVNLLAKDVEAKKLKDTVVVAPDVGGTIRARSLAKRIDAPLAIIEKRRSKANESEVLNVIGEVEGMNAVLIDDIIDTAGTICNAAEALEKAGAKSSVAYCTHGVFSGRAIEKLQASPLKEVVCTDSILMHDNVKRMKKLRQVSVAQLIGEAVRRTHQSGSVSELFEYKSE